MPCPDCGAPHMHRADCPALRRFMEAQRMASEQAENVLTRDFLAAEAMRDLVDRRP